jgi:hypothetical protein
MESPAAHIKAGSAISNAAGNRIWAGSLFRVWSQLAMRGTADTDFFPIGDVFRQYLEAQVP